MNEDHFREVDETMLFIEEARARAERARDALRAAGAEPHLVDALDEARRQLSAAQKRLLQQSHFAVPSTQTAF